MKSNLVIFGLAGALCTALASLVVVTLARAAPRGSWLWRLRHRLARPSARGGLGLLAAYERLVDKLNSQDSMIGPISFYALVGVSLAATVSFFLSVPTGYENFPSVPPPVHLNPAILLAFSLYLLLAVGAVVLHVILMKCDPGIVAVADCEGKQPVTPEQAARHRKLAAQCRQRYKTGDKPAEEGESEPGYHSPFPPGCSACHSCGVCVAELDHHCIWTRSDIGMYNRAFFLLWLLLVWAALGVELLALFHSLSLRWDVIGLDRKRVSLRRLLWVSSQVWPLAVLPGVFLLFIFVIVTVFNAYQLYLVRKGTTTAAMVRGHNREGFTGLRRIIRDARIVWR